MPIPIQIKDLIDRKDIGAIFLNQKGLSSIEVAGKPQELFEVLNWTEILRWLESLIPEKQTTHSSSLYTSEWGHVTWIHSLDHNVVKIEKNSAITITPEKLVQYGLCSTEMIEFIQLAFKSSANIVFSANSASMLHFPLRSFLGDFSSNPSSLVVSNSSKIPFLGQNVEQFKYATRDYYGLAFALREMNHDRILFYDSEPELIFAVTNRFNSNFCGHTWLVSASSNEDCYHHFNLQLRQGAYPVNLNTQETNSLLDRSIHLMINIARFPDGLRRISEISVLHDGKLKPLCGFQPSAMDDNGNITGTFGWSGEFPVLLNYFQDDELTPALRQLKTILKKKVS
tara:strand:- start:32216 stop:33238 length:1023 start_codon:yes stop_codon:yes gene_type:complete